MRKLLVLGLLLISLGGTVGAYAYWDDLTRNQEESLLIGEGTSLVVESVVSVPEGKYLVPAGTVLKANDIESLELKYNVKLNDEVSNDLYLYVRTDNVLINNDENLSELVHIDLSASVSTTEKYEISVSAVVSLDEPLTEEEYELVANSIISFDILFDASMVKREKVEGEILLAFSKDSLDDDVDDYLPVHDRDGAYIVLTGENEMTIEVGTDFTEPGFTAYNKIGGIESVTWTQGYFDSYNIGTYTMKYYCYSVYDRDFCETETRTVHVVDTTAPIINIADEIIIENAEDYNAWTMPSASDLGDYYVPVTASGNYDVDVNTPGTYQVTYYAVDDSGNETVKVVEYIVK